MDKACLEMVRVGNNTANGGREKGQGKRGGQPKPHGKSGTEGKSFPLGAHGLAQIGRCQEEPEP